MAQVVLENLCKSFPVRQGDTKTSLTMVEPTLAAPGLPQQAGPQAKSPKSDRSGSSGTVNILQHINLTIADGEFMVLVGPSGCGKSTLLRLIAGLEMPTAGNIWVGDRRVNDLPPKARDIAMVFQSYALYPHMTVYNNLAFGLRRSDQVKRSDISRRVQQVAQMLELDPLLQRYPKQLSGGQKQRVALGRAMAREPQVFLMDEPLSNLDAKLRAQTRAQIVQLQRQLATTTIYVTHDQTEAMTMGDRIAVLNGGEIQQIAAPLELYQKPANRFVAEFIGSPPMNFIEMTVKGGVHLYHPSFQLMLPEVWGNTLRQYVGQSVTLGIRPEHFTVAVKQSLQNLPVEVVLVEALGHETNLTCHLDAQGGLSRMLQVRVGPQQVIQNGDHLWLGIDPNQIHLFEVNSGAALLPF